MMKDTTVLKDGPVRVQYGRSQRMNQYPQSGVKGIIIRATSCAGLRPGVAESGWQSHDGGLFTLGDNVVPGRKQRDFQVTGGARQAGPKLCCFVNKANLIPRLPREKKIQVL